MDCVLGYHLNPLTCGVAKCNSILAGRLGVPVVGVFDGEALKFRQPLLSIKVSELDKNDIVQLDHFLDAVEGRQALRVFLHDFSGTEIELRLVRNAEVVYSGNAELTDQLQEVRPDVVELWCPPMLLDTQTFSETDLSVFSFGMAHKVRSDYYGKLHSLLESTQKSYCIYLSTGLHENTSFDGSFANAFGELDTMFGSNIYFMGFLSDVAVYNYLAKSTFLAAFFDKGVRANNSSINAAMQSGSVVITNLDRFSPSLFVHGENILDIRQLESVPTDPRVLSRLSNKARQTAESLGWEPFMEKLLFHETQRSG